MTQQHEERPTLFYVFGAALRWLRWRWHLIWLLPDLVLFGAVVILTATFIPLVANFIGQQVDARFLKLAEVTSRGAMTIALGVLSWRLGRWFGAYHWRLRATPRTWGGIIFPIALATGVGVLVYSGAQTSLVRQLELPALSELRGNSENQSCLVANESLSDSGMPIIEGAYRRMTDTLQKRKELSRVFGSIENRYQCPVGLFSEMNDLPESLTAAVIAKESGGDPKARSPQDAAGLMQLMPVNYGQSNPYDPKKNIELGTRKLRELIDKHGGVPEALAYYNAKNVVNVRAEAMATALGHEGFWARWNFLPKETREYVPEVLAIQRAWEEWKTHGRIRPFEERHGLEAPQEALKNNTNKIVATKAPKQTRRYVVQSGDTATKIAKQYQVLLGVLATANPNVELERLVIGQSLVIPVS